MDRKSSRLVMGLALGGLLIVIAVVWLVKTFAS